VRIGFDLDGVLVNFVAGYQRLIVEVTGEDKFQPGDIDEPPVWYWPELRGYTKEQIGRVWGEIKESSRFWADLDPIEENVSTLRLVLPDLLRRHDIYYVTNRMGVDAKWQTEMWLQFHVGAALPTVLLTEQKGAIASALRLDVYIDDKLANADDVADKSPSTRNYLLDRAYNRGLRATGHFARVRTLGQMLDKELNNL
jgi:hypothetical protein